MAFNQRRKDENILLLNLLIYLFFIKEKCMTRKCKNVKEMSWTWSTFKDCFRRYSEYVVFPGGFNRLYRNLLSNPDLSFDDQMMFEICRLRTFSSAPDSLPAIKLAREGFYYTGIENRCRCAFCGLQRNDWDNQTNVQEEHRRLRPTCPLVLHTADLNVPIINREDDQRPENDQMSQQPKHLVFVPTEKREESFIGAWPHFFPNAARLVEAGFFYTGRSDRVICAFCGISLHSWTVESDPLIEHAYWSPNCSFMLNTDRGRELCDIVRGIEYRTTLNQGDDTGGFQNLTRKDALKNKLEISKKQNALQDIRLAELDLRFQVLQTANYDGILVWKIIDYSRRKCDAINGRTYSLFSQPFYTGRFGYKMCGRVYLNGDGMGKGSHLSLFFVIMKGKYDAIMPWPFQQNIQMALLDQEGTLTIQDSFRPDPSSSSFQRPTTDMNTAAGCPMFVLHTKLETRRYLKDDTIFIKIVVDTSGLPHH